MSYEKEMNQEYIKGRMIDATTADIDTREGSFTYDALAPVANEISKMYFELNGLLKQVFITTSYGSGLDNRAKEFGLIRKVGTIAKGQVTFTGGDNVNIPAGTIIRTADGLIYYTMETVILNRTITVDIVASGKGTKYNVPAGTIMETDAKGQINFVNNLLPITGGTDDESDTEFRNRILQRMQNPPGSGNKADYETWSKEITGVTYVKVVPIWNGPGTVKVVVGGNNGVPVTQETITELQTYLDPQSLGIGEGKAPVGATVTVVNIEPITIDVEINALNIINGYNLDTVKKNIKKSLDDLMNKLNPGQAIRYNEIISAIIGSDGVDDFSLVKVNNKTSNVAISDEQKSVIGTISYV